MNDEDKSKDSKNLDDVGNVTTVDGREDDEAEDWNDDQEWEGFELENVQVPEEDPWLYNRRIAPWFAKKSPSPFMMEILEIEREDKVRKSLEAATELSVILFLGLQIPPFSLPEAAADGISQIITGFLQTDAPRKKLFSQKPIR